MVYDGTREKNIVNRVLNCPAVGLIRNSLHGLRREVPISWKLHVKRRRIGVNNSDRKSGTERTKKRKKWELVLFVHPPGGASGTVVV